METQHCVMELRHNQVLIVARISNDGRVRTRNAGNVEIRLRDRASGLAITARPTSSRGAVAAELKLYRCRGPGRRKRVEKCVQPRSASVHRIEVERRTSHIVDRVGVDLRVYRR